MKIIPFSASATPPYPPLQPLSRLHRPPSPVMYTARNTSNKNGRKLESDDLSPPPLPPCSCPTTLTIAIIKTKLKERHHRIRAASGRAAGPGEDVKESERNFPVKWASVKTTVQPLRSHPGQSVVLTTSTFSPRPRPAKPTHSPVLG